MMALALVAPAFAQGIRQAQVRVAVSPTASPWASATSSASMEELPESGGIGTWVALTGALALMSCGIGAIALVLRSVTW